MKLSSRFTSLARRSLFAGALSLASLAYAADPEGQVAHLDRMVENSEKPGGQFLCQNNVDLNPELSYKLTFWAKSSTLSRVRISTKVSQAPWATFGKRNDLDLTAEWAQYEVIIPGEGAVPGFTRVTFGYAGIEPGQIWIADVRMQAEAAPATAENLITNGRFEDGLEKWYTEGQLPGQFKVEVQSLAEANTPTQ